MSTPIHRFGIVRLGKMGAGLAAKHTRLDTRQPALALLSTIALALDAP